MRRAVAESAARGTGSEGRGETGAGAAAGADQPLVSAYPGEPVTSCPEAGAFAGKRVATGEGASSWPDLEVPLGMVAARFFSCGRDAVFADGRGSRFSVAPGASTDGCGRDASTNGSASGAAASDTWGTRCSVPSQLRSSRTLRTRHARMMAADFRRS